MRATSSLVGVLLECSQLHACAVCVDVDEGRLAGYSRQFHLSWLCGRVQTDGGPYEGHGRNACTFCDRSHPQIRTWCRYRGHAVLSSYRRCACFVVASRRHCALPAVAPFLLRLTPYTPHSYGRKDLSFPTIAGEGKNGAIIHYGAEQSSCGIVGQSSMLLLDSGAQYIDGTTDVTRTMHFGEPTAEQKEVRRTMLSKRAAGDASALNSPHLPAIA